MRSYGRISQYTVDQIDDTFQVVNPTHRKLSQQSQKLREKIQRRNAQLYLLKEESALTSLDQTPAQAAKQQKIQAELDHFRQIEEALIKQRKRVPYKITIKDRGEHRYYSSATDVISHKTYFLP